jgi:hypothetical protein
MEEFIRIRRVSKGMFSEVWQGHHADDPSRLLALKVIYPTSHPERVLNELHCIVALLSALSLFNYMIFYCT